MELLSGPAVGGVQSKNISERLKMSKVTANAGRLYVILITLQSGT
jgi:hypothetical protein